MALVELGVVKGHLRILHDDEDAQITVYRDAAESIVTEYLDRKVEPAGTVLPGEEDEGYDEYAIVVTPAIVAAILLVVGDLYEFREPPENSEDEAMLSPVVRRLLAPWRVWRTFVEDEE